MSAQPIFDIFRAVFIELVKNDHQSDADKFAKILAAIGSEYQDLVSKRNNLLHGTWLIGVFDAANPASESFFVNKYKMTKSGMERVEMPKNVEELNQLGGRCKQTALWIVALHACRLSS